MEENTATVPGHRLIVEPDKGQDSDEFGGKFESSIERTRDDLINVCSSQSFGEACALNLASEKIKEFKPVPWFVWRLTNHVFSPGIARRGLAEGFVLGLRRLLFASASDALIGKGEKVNSVKEALSVLHPEVVGVVSAMHAICRKLSNRKHERIWMPIVDDALIQARIGYLVGRCQPDFGGGKGMLVGFLSRIGLAIVIACGDEEQAQAVLERMAHGEDTGTVGNAVYGCHPLYIGAMVLSAIGCGGNACFGMIASLSSSPLEIVGNFEQRQWLAALTVCEAMRSGDLSQVDIDHWTVLGLDALSKQQEILEASKPFIRRDHGMHWIV